MEDVQTINELDALVGRIFSIEDITLGSAKDKYLVRYRGRLYSEDSAAAYDHLAALLRPHAVTPLFRMEGDRQAILLVSGVVPPVQASNPWVNLGLFVLTLLSVLLTGGLSNLNGPLPPDLLPAAGMIVRQGWPFAVSMLGILGAHEFGHYLMGRYHGVHVSLPYFIPLPLVSPFGTMGAFINMKEPPKNRRVLLDIAIAGPLAGAAVAIPVLLIGLSLSALNRLPAADLPGLSLQLEGNSILYLLAKFLVFGAWLPAPVDYHGVAPLLYWGKYFLTGMPFP
ncbi:MAG: site-2 protease family protein, partial [Chloroflexi bacterium]|nr:site-2 protease family protein [Chloroflexota bacterium]